MMRLANGKGRLTRQYASPAFPVSISTSIKLDCNPERSGIDDGRQRSDCGTGRAGNDEKADGNPVLFHAAVFAAGARHHVRSVRDLAVHFSLPAAVGMGDRLPELRAGAELFRTAMGRFCAV